jgi:NAD(P)-dependent dehydrogenase (short-subunit alcohol dehydrogenase family)
MAGRTNLRRSGMAGSERVLITGAGSGLGQALALRYGRDGHRIACADIQPERAQATVDQLRAAGVEALAFAVDVADPDSVAALQAALQAAWGGIDVLVNNAGVSSAGSVADTALEDWHWMLQVNLMGVVHGCRCFLPGLVAQGRGRIINIASYAALAGAPGIAPYAVAKAGVVALSESLRAELDGTGVGVSVACPSFFPTRLLENFRAPASRYRTMAEKLMSASRTDATRVADAIVHAAAADTFLILPTPEEPARWRLKRWFPELYFKLLMRRIRARSKPP